VISRGATEKREICPPPAFYRKFKRVVGERLFAPISAVSDGETILAGLFRPPYPSGVVRSGRFWWDGFVLFAALFVLKMAILWRKMALFVLKIVLLLPISHISHF